MLSDEDILERGGTQEDINAYAHDVGGACGKAYDGQCDRCDRGASMKDTETLDEAVRMFAGYVRGENGFDELDFKEWLIEWHNKHELQARLDELDYIYAAGNPVHTAIDGEKVHIFDRMEALKQELEKL